MATDMGVGPRCKGMLAGAPQGIASGVHGAPGRSGGNEDIPQRGNADGSENAAAAADAGTSRSRGRRCGRHGDEGFNSEAE